MSSVIEKDIALADLAEALDIAKRAEDDAKLHRLQITECAVAGNRQLRLHYHRLLAFRQKGQHLVQRLAVKRARDLAGGGHHPAGRLKLGCAFAFRADEIENALFDFEPVQLTWHTGRRAFA